VKREDYKRLIITKGGTGSPLRATAAVSLTVMTSFGSAVLAQQPQTTGIVDWFGTIKKTGKGILSL
jgi:hypothetical protein